MTIKTTLLAGITAGAMFLGGTSVTAQSVPVLGSDGWELPPQTDARPIASLPLQSSGVEQWRDEAEMACNGDAGCVSYVLSVIECESGGDPNAVGPNGELGILQVDPSYWGVMSSYEQIEFLLNPPSGAWWVCQ